MKHTRSSNGWSGTSIWSFSIYDLNRCLTVLCPAWLWGDTESPALLPGLPDLANQANCSQDGGTFAFQADESTSHIFYSWDIMTTHCHRPCLSPTVFWWRHSQVLTDSFWLTFIQQYLPSLQGRSKCQAEEKQLTLDKMVLIVDPQLPWTLWPVARVVNTHSWVDGHIQSGTIKVKN